MPISSVFTPRSPLFGKRSPILQPLSDRLLTEDGSFLTTEDGHFINLEVNGKLAGFALVSQVNGETGFSKFFIMRKYRRQGIGAAVARDLFARFPGPWLVEQLRDNGVAQQFWRTVIGRATQGEFRERFDYERGRVIQEFRIKVTAGMQGP